MNQQVMNLFNNKLEIEPRNPTIKIEESHNKHEGANNNKQFRVTINE